MCSFQGFDQVGLCQDCVFVKLIKTNKDSNFTFCRLSETRPEFPKYPVLPVLYCKGYKTKSEWTTGQ